MPSLLAGRQQGIRVICNHIPLIPPQLRKAARRACHQGMQSLATKRRHGNAIPKMKRRSRRRRSSKKKKKERRRSKRKKKEEKEKEKEKKKKRERVRPNLEDSKDAAPPLSSLSLYSSTPPHTTLSLSASASGSFFSILLPLHVPILLFHNMASHAQSIERIEKKHTGVK